MVRLWSRNGKDFTAKFPDVQAALEAQLTVDCVLDGELVVWTRDRLDFDALQQRNVNTAATVQRHLAPTQPASFVAFDLLAVGDVDIRPVRWTARRNRLELLAEHWTAPLQLSPVTADVDEAREWLDAFRSSGIDGLVVKGAPTRYQPGCRDWIKVKYRDTVDAIVGAVPATRAVASSAGTWLGGAPRSCPSDCGAHTTARRHDPLCRHRIDNRSRVGRTRSLVKAEQDAELRVDRPAGVRRCEHSLACDRVNRTGQRRVGPTSSPLWIRGLLQPLDERPHIEPFGSLPGPVLAMHEPEPAQQIERIAA